MKKKLVAVLSIMLCLISIFTLAGIQITASANNITLDLELINQYAEEMNNTLLNEFNTSAEEQLLDLSEEYSEILQSSTNASQIKRVNALNKFTNELKTVYISSYSSNITSIPSNTTLSTLNEIQRKAVLITFAPRISTNETIWMEFIH